MRTRLKPREQGDVGELSAIDWLGSQGAYVFIPLGHSPDYDLVADMPDGRLLRVQVKTTTQRAANARYCVSVCTRGGNQSWNRITKKFASSRCDYLFVLAEDGRRWFIPADAVEGGTAIVVGGPKYAEYEVDRGRPILAPVAAESLH